MKLLAYATARYLVHRFRHIPGQAAAELSMTHETENLYLLGISLEALHVGFHRVLQTKIEFTRIGTFQVFAPSLTSQAFRNKPLCEEVVAWYDNDYFCLPLSI